MASRTNPLDPDLEPWRQQPGETPGMFNRFRCYLDQGRTRTNRKTAEMLNITPRTCQQYAWEWSWQKRAIAYDTEQDRLLNAELAAHRSQMVRDHLEIAESAKTVLRQVIASIDPTTVRIGDAARLLDVITKLERTTVGEPERTLAVQGTPGTPLRVAQVPATEDERQIAINSLLAEVVHRIGTGPDQADTDALLDLDEGDDGLNG